MAQRFDDSRSGGDNRNQGRGGDRHSADRRRRDDAPRNRSGARDYRSEGQRGHYRNHDEHSHDRRHDGERYGERSNSPYGERRDGGRNWRDGERREDRPAARETVVMSVRAAMANAQTSVVARAVVATVTAVLTVTACAASAATRVHPSVTVCPSRNCLKTLAPRT